MSQRLRTIAIVLAGLALAGCVVTPVEPRYAYGPGYVYGPEYVYGPRYVYRGYCCYPGPYYHRPYYWHQVP